MRKQIPLDASWFVWDGLPHGQVNDDKKEDGGEDTPLPHSRLDL